MKDLYNSITTFDIDVKPLEQLANTIDSALIAIFAVLVSLLGTAIVVMLTILFIKAGFATEPEKRKKYWISIGVLAISIIGVIIAWLLKSNIIDLLVNNFK